MSPFPSVSSSTIPLSSHPDNIYFTILYALPRASHPHPPLTLSQTLSYTALRPLPPFSSHLTRLSFPRPFSYSFPPLVILVPSSLIPHLPLLSSSHHSSVLHTLYSPSLLFVSQHIIFTPFSIFPSLLLSPQYLPHTLVSPSSPSLPPQSLLEGSVTLEMEVRPRYLVPDTNCFIEHLDVVQDLAGGPYTVMVPLVGE